MQISKKNKRFESAQEPSKEVHRSFHMNLNRKRRRGLNFSDDDNDDVCSNLLHSEVSFLPLIYVPFYGCLAIVGPLQL